MEDTVTIVLGDKIGLVGAVVEDSVDLLMLVMTMRLVEVMVV